MNDHYCLKCEHDLRDQSRWDYECDDKLSCLERRVEKLEREVVQLYDPGSMEPYDSGDHYGHNA